MLMRPTLGRAGLGVLDECDLLAVEFGHVRVRRAAGHRPELAHEVALVGVAAPGRHQPGTGTVDVHGCLTALEEVGYAGWVGLEYAPLGPSLESFGWLR